MRGAALAPAAVMAIRVPTNAEEIGAAAGTYGIAPGPKALIRLEMKVLSPLLVCGQSFVLLG